MNKKFTRLTAALALLLFIAPPLVGWGQNTYTKVTETPSDWTGTYVIVADASEVIFTGQSGSNAYGGSAAVTITNSSVTGNYTAYEVEVEKSGSYYTIKHTSSSKYLGWESGNNLHFSTAAPSTNAYKWSLSTSSILNANDNNRKLQYNSGSPRFACYTSSQKVAYLYKKEVNENPTIFFNSESANLGIKGVGDEFTTSFTVSQENLEDDITLTLVGQGSLNVYSIEQGADPTEVTWTYTPNEAININTTITASSEGADPVTFTITGVAKAYHNIITSGITNGTVTANPAQAYEGQYVDLTVTPDQGYGLDELMVVDANNTPIEYITFDAYYRFQMPDSEVTVNATFVEVGPTTTDVLDLEFTGRPQSTTYGNWSGKEGASGAVYAGNSAGGNNSIQLRNNNSSGIVTTASGGKVKKVTVTWNSNTADDRTLDIYGKNTAYSGTSDLYGNSTQGTKLGSIVKGTSIVLTISGNYEYIGLRSNNGAMYLDEIDIDWETDGTPSISANDVEITYDATNGSIAYTVSNEPTPAGTLTAAVVSGATISNLSLGTPSNGTIAFTCDANDATTARTATVTLTYTYNSQTVTKDVTITQAAAPVIYTTIPALFEAATNAGNTATDVTVTFGNWVVTGANNSSHSFVSDGTNGFMIYGSGQGFLAGDVLSGTVECKVQLYNGAIEITQLTSTTAGLTVTSGGTVTVANIPMADLAGINTGALVSYQNLTCEARVEGSYTNYYLSDGTTEIQAYKTLLNNYADYLENGKTYNITGVFVLNNSTKRVNPRSAADIEEIVPIVPTITVDPATVNAPSVDAVGILTVSYSNMGEVNDILADVAYYEADGETPATYDWFTANIKENDNNTVEYLAEDNEGAARTAYFKVYGTTDGETFTYSNLVTFSQAKCDYATLPFAFAGGTKEELVALYGVTGYGLGSDYAATNAPYRVKFDTDGDYILIKTDQRPGVVSFGIKKLGGAGDSSITIEGSSDGETFTAIETFANEGNANAVLLHETSVAFGANDRYVRIYFNKPSTGGANVGVGPISIAKYEAPAPYINLVADAAVYTPVDAYHMEFSYNVSGGGPIDNVEYGNFQSILEFDDFDIQFCDVNGDPLPTQAAPDWFMNDSPKVVFYEPDNTISLCVEVLQNETANDRYCYFKVYAMDVNDLVYSDLVTVHQTGMPYTLTVTELSHVNLFIFGGDESEPIINTEEGENTAQVTCGTNVEISVDVEAGYVLESLVVDGVDVTGLIEYNLYSFTMPSHAVNITATANPFEPILYTRVTKTSDLINNGHYIIVGFDNVDHDNAYAMGEQKSNNRAAVIISEDGTNAIVVNQNVYDFVISEVTDGQDTYYSIYDATNSGYLYAASSNSNHLKTESELSVDSKWEISFDNDGNTSVSAPNSSNRNVMQFNSASEIFSCYSSASQKPVYLYVKANVEPTTNNSEITGTDFTATVPAGYRLIASPFNNINPMAVAGMVEVGGERNYDLYYFDQDAEAEWQNYKVTPFNLKSGKGYLYANSEDVTLSFSGVPYNGSGEIELVYSEGKEFAGWNLVGNPFGVNAIIDIEDFYIMNPQNGAELIQNSGEIAAMQGIFVLATEAGQNVTFTQVESDVIDINPSITAEVSNGRSSVIDRAIVRFGEGGMLPKFQLNPDNTKLYIPQNGNDYAVVRSNNEGEMPVNFKASKNGTYTINVNAENTEMNYMHLIDNMTGADIDLLATPSYSFEAKTTDYASRFRLVFNANNGSNENSIGSETFAYYNGSEWVISNMGEATLQVVDVMGRVLSTETVNGNATINLNQTPGVYLFRLINGDSVKVQKVVVR